MVWLYSQVANLSKIISSPSIKLNVIDFGTNGDQHAVFELNEEESTLEGEGKIRPLYPKCSGCWFGPCWNDGFVDIAENPRIVIYPLFAIPELHLEGDGKEYNEEFHRTLR